MLWKPCFDSKLTHDLHGIMRRLAQPVLGASNIWSRYWYCICSKPERLEVWRARYRALGSGSCSLDERWPRPSSSSPLVPAPPWSFPATKSISTRELVASCVGSWPAGASGGDPYPSACLLLSAPTRSQLGVEHTTASAWPIYEAFKGAG